MIRKMRQDPISTENIAWFIMSSNDSMPILLDSSDIWNRRFSIIKTWSQIKKDRWEKIAEAIRDKKNIENFLAALFELFPWIEKEKNIFPLENEDKKDLEFLSETAGNLFFKWIEEKYPNINRISNTEREFLLEIYRKEIGENDYNDERYKVQNINRWLSLRYKPTTLKIRWNAVRWYLIDKKVNWPWEFPHEFFDIKPIKPKWII